MHSSKGLWKKIKARSLLSNALLTLDKRLGEAVLRVEYAPRHCDRSTEAGTAICAVADSGKPPPFLCALKTKWNKTHFLQCTQENVWHLLPSSILAMFHYLSNGTLVLCQEKYLFPILIMLPDYPLAYILPGLLSIRATIWMILQRLWWNLSLTVLARAGICSRVGARHSQGERSASL